MNAIRIEERVWRTAAVVDAPAARRGVGRLTDSGLNFQVVPDDRHLRILVRRVDLEEAVNLLADIGAKRTVRRGSRHSLVKARVLFALPLGAAIGSLISHWLSWSQNTTHLMSAACAFLMTWLFSIDLHRAWGRPGMSGSEEVK